MANELTEQQLLDTLHAFFKRHNREHMSSKDATEFNQELQDIMDNAVKNFGLQKTTDFAIKHATEFGKYDIEIDNLKMSDVVENRFDSWLFKPINNKREALYGKATKSLQDKFGINSKRKKGVRSMNGMYVSGPYIMTEKDDR